MEYLCEKSHLKILLAQQLFLAHLRLCSLQNPSNAEIISLKRRHSARVSPYSIRCRRKVLRLDIASICQNKSDSFIAYSIGFSTSTAEMTEANNDSDQKLNHTPLRLRVAPLPFMTGVKVRVVSRWHISIPFQFSHFTCLQHTGRARHIAHRCNVTLPRSPRSIFTLHQAATAMLLT